jgi:antitoxin HicB
MWKEDGVFLVQFPDMTNIQTFGRTEEEALAMAKEALDGCLEVDISMGNHVPPPSYAEGHPVPVANHIVVSLQLRELRGSQSQSAIAQKLGFSYQSSPRKPAQVKSHDKNARKNRSCVWA